MPGLTLISWNCVHFKSLHSKKVAGKSLDESHLNDLKAGEIALQWEFENPICSAQKQGLERWFDYCLQVPSQQ